MGSTKYIRNAAGREVPETVNGRVQVPFRGINKHFPEGRKYGPPIPTCNDYPADGDKRVPTLKEALVRCGLKDGMCISTHHHFRNGDLLANQVFDAASELGARDLVWFPSASFLVSKATDVISLSKPHLIRLSGNPV